MKLVVFARNNEEQDMMHGRVVDSLEIDALDGASENSDNIFELIRKGVRNGDARSNAGADLLLAGVEGVQYVLIMALGQMAAVNQVIDQLDDCRPTLGLLHVEDDTVRVQ